MSRDNNRPLGRAFVTEDEVEEALRFLALSAEDIGEARGEMVRTEFMIGSVEALAANMSEERSADAKKWDARATSQYQAAITAHAEATARFETFRARREAARMKCDAWQTMSANRRGGI